MPHDQESGFGARLRRFREAAGLTQEQLAERAGLTPNAISALERGERRRPYAHTVQALVEALSLSDGDAEVLAASVPRRAATQQSAPGTGQLPSAPTPLIGREQDVARLAALFREGVRLVTLTGPGGVGKTRLATEVAGELGGRYADGVVFVALAPLADATLVVPTIAQALGVREAGGEPLRSSVHAFLRDRDVLLVLDNLEHLIQAASEVAEMIAAADGLDILATSRAPLRVRSEREFPVRPLALPDLRRVPRLEEVAENPSMELFVERAQAVDPGFALAQTNAATVAAICRRLDGLPLAIELAAARVRSLDPTTLLARLDRALPLLADGARDLPERLQTMERTIGWSYDLLDPSRQALFRRLAVFAGGWTLEAAEAVGSGPGTAAEEVLGLLAGLVEQSLVVMDACETARYRLLEPVRQYAWNALEQSGEEGAVSRAHSAYFVALAERLVPDDDSLPDGNMERLEADRDNFRSALAWLDRTGDCASFLRLAGRLWWYWRTGGHLAEGRRWMERALAKPEGPPLPRSEAFYKLGQLTYLLGDEAGAVRSLEESLAIARDIEGAGVWPLALGMLGAIARDDGRYDEAERLLGEALDLLRRFPGVNRSLVGEHIRQLGLVALERGDLVRAAELCEEALRVVRSAKDAKFVPYALESLSLVACARGDLAGAADMLRESLDQAIAAGDVVGLRYVLADAGVVAASAGDAERAARLFGAVAALQETFGGIATLPRRSMYGRSMDAARATLGEASFAATRDAGRRLSAAQAAAEARGFLEAPLPAASGPAASPGLPGGLTAREAEVLRLVSQGMTNPQVANQLFLSPRTVDAHMLRILSKLEVPNRGAAIRFAVEHGLV